jgi:hypothetical protein
MPSVLARASGILGAVRERPGERVVEQRIRNRVLEYFDLAASFERQREYEQAAPIAHVPYEVINQWGDNFPRGLQRDLERSSVYSADEIAALRHFEKVLGSTCRAVPDDYPTLAEVQALPAWEELRQAAESAHNVFARRGKMPEDEEAP